MTEHVQSLISPRSELNRFVEYKPGLSVQEIKRQYGLKRVIKMASNENPMGSSPRAVAAYKKSAEELFRYPESRSVDLRRLISDRFKLGIEEVIVGAGSDEVIDMLAKAYLSPGDEVVISESTFLEYQIASEIMGAKVILVPMNNYKTDLMALVKNVTDKTKMIFIANPNNPTGTYNKLDEMKEFMSRLPEHVFPVIDEAYFEYASEFEDYPSAIHQFFRKRPMMVLRTFSKAYGLAGLRVGYGVGPEAVIKKLDQVRPPFNVAVPAQVAAMAALGDRSFIEKSVKSNKVQMDYLVKELTHRGFKLVPSVTNFILFNVAPQTGRHLFERLLRKGIVTRAVDEYGLKSYLRVTVGTASENKIFLKALKEVVEEK